MRGWPGVSPHTGRWVQYYWQLSYLRRTPSEGRWCQPVRRWHHTSHAHSSCRRSVRTGSWAEVSPSTLHENNSNIRSLLYAGISTQAVDCLSDGNRLFACPECSSRTLQEIFKNFEEVLKLVFEEILDNKLTDIAVKLNFLRRSLAYTPVFSFILCDTKISQKDFIFWECSTLKKTPPGAFTSNLNLRYFTNCVCRNLSSSADREGGYLPTCNNAFTTVFAAELRTSRVFLSYDVAAVHEASLSS